MKIDQEPNLFPAQAHVGEELRVVYAMKGFYAFHFDDYKVFDHHVHPKSKFDFFAVINDRQLDLG